jgi:UDP-N-acetylglucosamine acyltransferase
MSQIHSTAWVHDQASIGANVTIGPFALIEAGSVIGDDCVIGPRVHIYGGSILGRGVRVWDNAIIGADPQDLSYKNEATTLEIGDYCVIREFATLNRGTLKLGRTFIGKSVLVMAYCHVGHDCTIQDRAILANRVQLGGHVEVGQSSIIGGVTAIHQFSRVGEQCYVGGTLKIDRDVPPFSKALGDPLSWAGINHVGLKRNGFNQDEISEIHRIYRMLYGKNAKTPLEMAELMSESTFAKQVAKFFTESKNGCVRRAKVDC